MVKFAVFVKEVPDIAQLRIDPATREPKLEGLPTKVNDFDKHAVEEAVRIKGEVPGSTITVFSVKGKKLKETVKEPLAMGADKAVIVPHDGPLDAWGTAKILAKAVQKHGPFDLIFCGELSLDVNAGEVPARVAGLLGYTFTWNAKEVKKVEAGAITLVRDAEQEEEVKIPFPALVTMNDEINNPRLPALMQILAAGKKPIQEETLQTLGLTPDDVKPVAVLVANKAPKSDRKRILFSGGDREEKLAEALKQEGIL